MNFLYIPGQVLTPVMKKIWNVTKMTMLALILFPSSISATVYSQETKLSLKVHNQSIKEALFQIEKQSEFRFIYQSEKLNLNKKVSVNIDNQTIDIVLSHLFKGENVNYEITENNLILINPAVKVRQNSPSVEATQQDNRRISGIVVDSQGNTIIGATVLEEGTSNGTITDFDGKFNLSNVNPEGKLVVSYIGYETRLVPVNNQTSIKIALTEDSQLLEEVVVVGYGVQKKASVTGSVASIQTKDITTAKTANVTNALAGKLPGLRAVQRSGQPGEDAAKIDIRGFGDPLVIVDGIERDFSQIDANDIESISILKDASAAVYGFKGANGVILVTTKKGEVSKPKISYSGYLGFQTETRFAKLYNSYEYATLWNEAQLNVGVRAPYTQEEIEKYKAGNDPDYPDNNWWDLMTRDLTPQMYHNLSVSGGTEKVKYYFSLAYTSQDGIWASKEENFSRYNVRSNISAEIVKGLTVALQLHGRLDNRFTPNDAGRFHTYFKVHPNVPVYANNNPDYYQHIGDNVNPIQGLYSDEMGYSKRDRREFNGSIMLNWEIPWVKGLSAKALLAYDYNNSFTKDWAKEYSAYQYDAVTEAYIKYSRRTLSTLNSRSDHSFSPTQQYSLNYQNTFGNHDFNALVVWELRNWRRDWISASRQFYIGAIDQLEAGDNVNKDNNGNQDHSAHAGLVGRLNYAYAGKYLAEFSFRYDGSYKFAPDNRWGFFPALTLGWRISEESFFKNKFNFVDNLKIRGSWGQTGDERIYDTDGNELGAYQHLTGYIYPSGTYILGSGGVLNGVVDKGIPNLALTWYKSNTINIGFEASVLNGLISMEFDYFERRRKGLLANRSLTLPTTFGKTLPQENLNSDITRGFEIVLGHHNKIGQVTYNVTANFTSTRQLNKYVERPPSGNMYDNWRYNTNNRYKSITWGYETLGQFKSFEEILNAPIQDGNGNKSLLPGDIRYKDLNGDGIISELDEKPIAHGTDPSMYYGLNLSAEWKGIDLNVFFQGAAGHEIISIETWTDPFIQDGLGNGVVFWLDRWHRENPEDMGSAWIPGYMPAVRPSGFELNDKVSTWSVLKQNYLRLKTIELGYTLPKEWISKIGLENVRIYANGYNILTFTQGRRMKYMDPENEDAYIKAYPPMKSFNFGLNLTF